MSIDDLGLLFKFVGGFGMFLYGMNIMADGLLKTAGPKTKGLLKVLTKNRFLAVIFGVVVTAVVQSSSATTVMVVGFVNAKIIDLTQAVGVIMGANIGTTATSWIVSMSEWSKFLKPEFLAPLIIGIGAISITFSKNEGRKKVAEIATGFGMLFIGLSFMSSAIEPYRDSEFFSNIFTTLGHSPLLAILAGTLVTAIIQSSSASVGILQTLALNGMVDWNAAIFITLGQNIGTCVTALLSSMGAGREAKRASIIHLMFNLIGTIIFAIIMVVFFAFNKELAGSRINSVEISIFHTIFNVSNTIILFPFANLLVKVSSLIVKDKPDANLPDAITTATLHLDKRLLSNPNFAISAITNEVITMGELAYENVKLAFTALAHNDQAAIKSVFDNEKVINQFERLLTNYVVDIDNQSLTNEQHATIKNLLYSISDIERISDHCENIAELAQLKIADNSEFSEEGLADLNMIHECVLLSIENAINARKHGKQEYVDAARFYENRVDELEEKLREKHINRLSTQVCKTESGIIFLDAISNMERMSDHAVNIAEYVI